MEEEFKKRDTDLKKYGISSLSYLTISKDLTAFRSKSWDGFFAYKEFMSSAVILSDPVVPLDQLNDAVDDLIKTFTKNKKHLGFFLCTDNVVKTLIDKGFKTYYFGREAVVNLNKFTTDGKKAASIRSSVNYARRNNMAVEEYKYKNKRDPKIDKEITKISEQWKKTKNEPDLTFAFGHVNFEDYKDTRYFICKYEGKVVGFITYYPIYCGIPNYYLDMSRKGTDSPRGVIDFLHVESFEILKKEGVEKIYIGLAPLSHLEFGLKVNTEKYVNFLSFLHPLFESFYPAKSELFFKKKYATDWEPNYICFYPRISIRTLFSLLHAVYKGGFAGLLTHKVKNIFNK